MAKKLFRMSVDNIASEETQIYYVSMDLLVNQSLDLRMLSSAADLSMNGHATTDATTPSVVLPETQRNGSQTNANGGSGKQETGTKRKSEDGGGTQTRAKRNRYISIAW